MIVLGTFLLGVVLGMVTMAWLRAVAYQRQMETRLRRIARYSGNHPAGGDRV